MFLLVAPTKKELSLLESSLKKSDRIETLVSGVGILESSLNLAAYLAHSDKTIEGVVLVGIAGAYREGGAVLLDLCLASKEVIGDLGVCYPDRIEPLDKSFAPETDFYPDPKLLSTARKVLSETGTAYHEGVFVTVSSVSGTAGRGDYLRHRFNAICENMEGAAVARVCLEFDLPFIEIRSVSNMVVDRNDQQWDVEGAIFHCSEVVGKIMERFASES